jgi:hypothetical protein
MSYVPLRKNIALICSYVSTRYRLNDTPLHPPIRLSPA